jgi:hypothetical protein
MGGGVNACAVQTSFLIGNSAGDSGGGGYLDYGGSLGNCVVAGNSAVYGGGTYTAS